MSPDESATMRDHALSFATVAEAYDRARPSYPAEAACLAGRRRTARRVVELGAGTGKLTEVLVAAGHDVIATDPLPEMLGPLRDRVPGARAAVADRRAHPGRLALGRRRGLRAVVPLVRPRGRAARDRPRAPPRRRAGAGLERPRRGHPLGAQARCDHRQRRQPHRPRRAGGGVRALRPGRARRSSASGRAMRRDDLFDLVRSRSYVALLDRRRARRPAGRESARLYDDYGRGPDGMQLPYLTRVLPGRRTTPGRHRPTPPRPRPRRDPADRPRSRGRRIRPTIPAPC